MAVVFIIAILVVGLLLIATENINRMNRAAIAMFMGTFCWILYIGYGTQFVVSEHQIDFLTFLSNHTVDAQSVKTFIAKSIFFKHIVNAAKIVLFLIATMTIVEVLDNNGCFDFIREWLRTYNPIHFLWILSGLTFLISANLDNLTTVCLMLGITHSTISNEKQRMIMGAAIVVAANMGGAFTVIGDVTSLTLWNEGLVTPTRYSAMLVLPCIAALVTVLTLMSLHMPRRISFIHTAPPYRGDDTILTRPQRLLLLFVGIGGLWFIPTFHRITLLPPFLGSLCVLSLLWIVNELCNRTLIQSGQMVGKRRPMALQYVSVQHILLYIGLSLALGAISETGILNRFFEWSVTKLQDVYIIGNMMGIFSALLGNVTSVLANVFVLSQDSIATHTELTGSYGTDGIFWHLLSYTSAVGGSLLSIGTMAGVALMRTEGMTLRWYIQHISGKILAGWLVGFLVFYALS